MRQRTNMLLVFAIATVLFAVFVTEVFPRRQNAPAKVAYLKVLAPWSFELRVRRAFAIFQREHPLTQMLLVTGTPGKLLKYMKTSPDGDVYIAMGPVETKQLEKMGRLKNGFREDLVMQNLLLIRPSAKQNKTGVTVKSIGDLTKPEVKIVGLGRCSATAGTVAREILRKKGFLAAVEPKGHKGPLLGVLIGDFPAAFVYEECLRQEIKQDGKNRWIRPGVEVIQRFDSPEFTFPVQGIQLNGAQYPERARAFIELLKKTLPDLSAKELPNVIRANAKAK